MGFVAAEGVFRKRPEFLLLRVEAPAAEDDAKAGHYRDGQIDAKNAGDFASGHNTEDCGQWVQFHAFAHDAWRRDVILYQTPCREENDQHQPVVITRKKSHGDNCECAYQGPYNRHKLQYTT